MNMFAEYLKDEMELDRMNRSEQSGQNDQAQDDFELYEEFVTWIGEKVGNDLVVKNRNGDVCIEAGSSVFWLENGKIECSTRECREPWQLLWDIWQAELQA